MPFRGVKLICGRGSGIGVLVRVLRERLERQRLFSGIVGAISEIPRIVCEVCGQGNLRPKVWQTPKCSLSERLRIGVGSGQGLPIEERGNNVTVLSRAQGSFNSPGRCQPDGLGSEDSNWPAIRDG